MNITLSVVGLVIVVSLLGLFAVGCTSNKPFRTNFTECDPTTNPACANPVIEVTKNYKLGFVEFDDQGWFWDTKQSDAVEKMIRDEGGIGQPNSTQSLCVVVFVHGWKNNAATNNDNVEMFRKTLDQFGIAEAIQTNHAPRKVLGVYAGWRGLSATLEPFKEISFWNRKGTAHKVGGYGALTELLVELESLQQESNKGLPTNAPQSELIIVGHSFGGAAVYSAIGQIVTERFVDTIKNNTVLKPLGNQVILLNPAFEASRHYNLNQLAVSIEKYPTNQRPVLSIFTSKGDWATHYAFPIGRFFSTIFEKNRDSQQTKAGRDAVGWFEPFVTHDLLYDTNAAAMGSGATTLNAATKKHELHGREKLQATINNAREQKKKWHPNTLDPQTYYFDDSILKPRSHFRPGDPFLVVSVDKTIMKDHDDINNPVLINFLGEYITFCRAQP
ncbi:MAG TPA: esterase [Verrucomicrobiae bacterium]